MGMTQVDSILSPKARNSVEKPFDVEPSVHVDQLASEEAALIQNTQQAALAALANTEVPHPSDALAADRVTLGAPQPTVDPEAIETEETAALDPEKLEISRTAIAHFPSLALAAVELAPMQDAYTNQAIKKHLEVAKGYHKAIDLTLDLNAEFTSLGEGGAMTPRMNELVRELKGLGHDLKIEEGANLSREKILELKSLNSSFTDQTRSKLQILFTTQIQVLIQNNSSIMETLKKIVNDNSRFIEFIQGKTGAH